MKTKNITYKIDLLDKEFRQQLIKQAREFAGTKSINPDWARVYLRIVDAVNELDAYWARCEIK